MATRTSPWPCPCGQSFRSERALQRHQHTGTCPACRARVIDETARERAVWDAGYTTGYRHAAEGRPNAVGDAMPTDLPERVIASLEAEAGQRAPWSATTVEP